jgi:ascorbate-specific PTS system EIIC-type component UlaA
MTAGQKGFRRFFPVIGVVLLAAGLTVLAAQVNPVASRLWDRVGASADELGGLVPAAILTVNHAAQAWAFDRANLLSTLRHMLLSCWPVILVILGVALLRKTPAGLNVAREQS